MKKFPKIVIAGVWSLSTLLYAEVLYVSPFGNDANPGRSEKKPLQTLQKALKMAESMPLKENVVTVFVAPGTYITGGHRIKGRKDGKKIEIKGRYVDGKYPVFKPKGGCITWLVLKNQSGKPSNIVIENMKIDGFCTAISFNGNRDVLDRGNGKNVVRNNTFLNIGSTKPNRFSTAAIRLVNSKDNIIENNRFLTIRNVKKCKFLHAVYLAHHASRNIIRNNVFVDLCGSVIKTRDDSNFNIVYNNYFYGFDNAVFQEWFCNKRRNRKCTKKAGECPSFGNHFLDNIVKKSKMSRKKMFDIVPYKQLPWCRYQADDQPRLITK